MAVRGCFVSTLLLAALLALPLVADVQNPSHERGFSPEKAFELGDLDHVNLFNGGLVVTIPLGLSYPLDGGLSYQLTLVYNSNGWEWEEVCPPSQSCFFQSVPSPDFSTGFGWSLSLGKVHRPNTPPANSSSQWLYVGSDGADHLFYGSLHKLDPADSARYSRDGSYLRMKDQGIDEEIEFPDGSTHHFDFAGDLTEIRGRFQVSAGQPASWLRVTKEEMNGKVTRWDLTDSVNRTHHVHFGTFMVGGDEVQLVTRVEVAKFAGGFAVYTFEYESMTLIRPKADFNHEDNPIGLQLLTAVRLPEGLSFEMPKTSYDFEGRLGRLALPTKGALEWSYRTYTFPAPDAPRSPGVTVDHDPFNQSRGVGQRRLVDRDGVVVGSWDYVQGTLADDLHTRTTVTDPLGHRREHYFQADPDLRTHTLPYLATQSDGSSPGRFLSMQVFAAGATQPLRSRYVRYEWDAEDPLKIPNEVPSYDLNRRPVSERTVYHDDGNRYADIDRSRFDGLGHYREATTGGNFGAGNVRTEATEYNPERGEYPHLGVGSSFSMLTESSPWILGTHTERWSQEAATQAAEQLCFEQATGFLRWRRRYRNKGLGGPPPPSSTDIVERFTPDGRGNLFRQEFFGADSGGVPATSPSPSCGLSGLPLADYTLIHGYQSGVRATSRHSNMTYLDLDQTIDPSTGLVATSRDLSKLATSFEYDALGRLSWSKPSAASGDGWTHNLWAVPTEEQGAQVTLQRLPNGGIGPPLAEDRLTFDDFGRAAVEETLLPDGRWSLQETAYDALGQVVSKSEPRVATEPLSKTLFEDYDPFGRVGRITPPEGSAHELRFFYAGVRQHKRRAKVATAWNPTTGVPVETAVDTIQIFDRQGRLLKVQEDATGANLLTTYAYDVGNRLTQVTQTRPEGTQTRTFTYDQLGLLRLEQHPEKGRSGNGRVTFNDYDARGHARLKSDNGVVLRLVYDQGERLIREEEFLTGRVWKQFAYAANQTPPNYRLGKLLTATRHNYVLVPDGADLSVSETYTYKGRGGRVSNKTTSLSSGDSYTQSFVWNELGNLASQTYPQCLHAACAGTNPPSRSVVHGYTNGFLTSVASWADSITYHTNGMLARVELTGGATYSQAQDPHHRSRPGSIAADTASGHSEFFYSYDGSGNVVSLLDSSGAGEIYLYDRLGRLAQATLGGGESQSYQYDGFGNLTRLGSRSIAVVPTTNRLSAAGYDDRGNVTINGVYTYRWDALDMMQSLRGGGNSRGYVYTADDERILSHDCQTQTSTWRLRGLDGKVLREYRLLNNGDINSCAAAFAPLAGPTWVWEKDWVYRDGTLLGSVDHDGQVIHYHPDHLGTPRLHTGPGGVVLGNASYFPFGEPAPASALASAPFATLVDPSTQLTAVSEEVMRFTGHERDANTDPGFTDDLDYMHARYYSPLLGRFLSFDPVGGNPAEPRSWNRYAYVLGNPVNFIDPLGLLEAAATFEDQITVCADALTGEPCSFTRSFFEMAQRFSQVNSMNHLPAELRGLSFQQMLTVLPPQPCEGFACRLLADVASERNAVAYLEAGVVEVTYAALGGEAFSLFSGVLRTGLGLFGLRAPANRIFSARVLNRAATESGPFHNFPALFDDIILSGRGRDLGGGFVQFSRRGAINGRAGIFEIGGRVSGSGRAFIIEHRFFRPY